MWRVAALVAGAGILLLASGIVQRWHGYLPEHPSILLLSTLILWSVALWGWGWARALIGLGATIFAIGFVMFFIYPNVVNGGSGQDAITLIGTVAGGTGMLIGTVLLLAGLLRRARQAP